MFAYHDVGARCLRALLAHGIRVPLVVTHADDPHENIWFERVADVAAKNALQAITPADPNARDPGKPSETPSHWHATTMPTSAGTCRPIRAGVVSAWM